MGSRLRDQTALGPGYAAVTRERERMTAELEAFEAFHSQVSQLETDGSSRAQNCQSEATQALRSRSPDKFVAVREAYRDTVLAVDHWATAYDEQTVEDSLPNEFSAELAHILLKPAGNTFSPLIAEQLERELRDSIQNRREAYDIVDEEASALETLMAELNAVLEAVRPVVDRDGSFAQRQKQLETALTTLDELAHTHQAYIHQRDERANHLLRGMVYADLQSAYPGLSGLVTVRRALEQLNLRFWAGLI